MIIQAKNSIRLFLLIIMMVNPSFGQDFSRDGNRWYEIEISIFTNQAVSFQDRERSLPANINLSYPDEILDLMPATASYSYNFSNQLANVLIGPAYSPSDNSFSIIDFSSDAFISLGDAHQQFQDINFDLSRSSEHRLLYHAMWRQPVLNKVQASAIFIQGGDEYGAHSELEGSVTISFNVNRVDIDTKLWLNSFMANINNEESSWDVPAQAFRNRPTSTGSSQEYFIESVAVMNESRAMRSNEFHYLDHPEFGLLIQIRPYQLPDNFDF